MFRGERGEREGRGFLLKCVLTQFCDRGTSERALAGDLRGRTRTL